MNIGYTCYADELTITVANDIGDQIYEFNQSAGAAVALTTPTLTHSVSDTGSCAVTYKLYGYDDADDVWLDYADGSTPLAYIVDSFNTSTGAISVLNTNG